MHKCKHVKVPIPMGEIITTQQFPRTHEEIEDTKCVPYASVDASLMYVMVCT
jgi:hypothetical protein